MNKATYQMNRWTLLCVLKDNTDMLRSVYYRRYTMMYRIFGHPTDTNISLDKRFLSNLFIKRKEAQMSLLNIRKKYLNGTMGTNN